MASKGDDSEGAKHSTSTESKGPSGMKSLVRVFSYADRTSRLLYVVAVIAAIAAGVTLPLTNIVFGQFVTAFNNFSIGELGPAGYMRQVEKLALYFVYLFIAKFALVYIHTVSVSLAAIRTTKALRLNFLDTLLRQEIAFFDSKDAGSPSIKVTTNGNLINNGISDKLTLTISSLATFLAAFVVAFAVQWKLTLIVIFIVPVVMVVTGISIALDMPMEAKVMSYYNEAAVIAEEVFSTITTVHAFWLQPLMSRRYDALLAEAQREGLKKSMNYGVMFSTQFFCVYSGYGLAFWQGIRMYVSGEITQPGQIVTVVFALILAATSLQTIAMQSMNVTKAASAASELFAVIDRESAIDPTSDSGLTPEGCEGHIQIRGLAFEYPSRPDSRVLNGLTLDIPPKKTTALVGASGSGKSTVVGLIDRWYDQTEGNITLDGTNLRELNVGWLRTKVRLVQQEPVLFSGTVFENVVHGLIGTQYENASKETRMQLVQEACKAAFAHDFVEQLPNGYTTEIGERARMLSGGQRQRLCIARSIISNPPVLLLDEATSALDPQAESVVQRALDSVSKSRTTLIIAHKIATVQKADNIAVMSQGAIIEQGTHQELLARDGAYARLVRAQDLAQGVGASGDAPEGKQSEDTEKEDGHLSRAPTKSGTAAEESDGGEDPEAQESMNYGLLKCTFLLIREQRRLWPFYIALSVTSLCAGGTWPVLAILFSRTFGTFQLQGTEARDQGNFWSLMFFVVAIANLVIYFNIGMICNNIAQRVTHIYRLETFNKTVGQEIAFFDKENNATGAITSRLSTVAADLNELLGFNCGIVLNNIVTVISCSVLGIAYGWKLGLVCAFAALPPMLVGAYYKVRLETKLDNDTVERFASSAALAAEAVAAIRTVASLTLERTVAAQYSERLSTVASKSARSLFSTMLLYSFTQAVNFLAMALGFWYGGKLVSSGKYTTQQFFVVFIAIVLGGENAAQIFSYSSGIMKAAKAANYIFWLRSRLPTSPAEEDGSYYKAEKDDEHPASVACEAVDFAYPTRPNLKVLRDVDIEVAAGKWLGVVGASGCGKSTMISLLTRFYDPSSGLIKVNDQSITEISPRTHRHRLAVVQQEPVLYSGTIRENVAMGMADSGEPSEIQVEKALSSANMLKFVRSLSEGLDTPLGTRGTQLSGGQKQRIAIARALIRDPKILLLDEASSALDMEGEKIVQAALLEAAKDGKRSTIAVAHRLSTIKDADTICVFHAGRIVEVGDHASLLAQRGMYFEMCRGQALDAAA